MFYKCFITVLVVSCSSLNTEYWILNTSKYSIFVRFQQPWNSWGLLLGLLHNSAVKQGNSANFHRKWWRNLLLARHHHDQKEFFAGNNSSLRKAKIGPCVYPFWLVSNMSRSNIPDPNGRVLLWGATTTERNMNLFTEAHPHCRTVGIGLHEDRGLLRVFHNGDVANDQVKHCSIVPPFFMEQW